jgi:hypothetical protein
MTDTPEAGWPKLPGGAIDWEAAFEDPQAGLIPLILRARTSTALRECMIAVVKKLYVRKDDPSEVERFVAQLTAMIPDQASPKQIARVADTMVGILRQIKTDRVRLAAAYEAAKVAAPPAASAVVAEAPEPIEDRRSHSERVSLVALARAAVAQKLKKIALAAGGTVGALVVAGVMIDTYIEGAPQREAKRNAALLLDQIQAASRGVPVGTHVFGGTIRVDRMGDRAAVVVEGLSPEQCANAGWMLAKTGRVSVDGSAPANTSLNAFRALCADSPAGAILSWMPRADDRPKGSGVRK